MAQELTDLIRRSRTVDRDKKESARAYMRTQVKHLLRKYECLPEKAKGAVDIVIKQAKLMSGNIVPMKKREVQYGAEESRYGLMNREKKN